MNLELRRKALLAIGWKAHPGMIYVEYYLQGHAEDAPAVESDTGVAITMLDEFCKVRSLHWQLEPDLVHTGRYICMIYGDSIPDDVDIEPCAEAIAEVCCLAVIAAAEREKKSVSKAILFLTVVLGVVGYLHTRTWGVAVPRLAPYPAIWFPNDWMECRTVSEVKRGNSGWTDLTMRCQTKQIPDYAVNALCGLDECLCTNCHP